MYTLNDGTYPERGVEVSKEQFTASVEAMYPLSGTRTGYTYMFLSS